MLSEEEEFYKAAQSGDDKTFEKILNRYDSRLLSLCRKMLGGWVRLRRHIDSEDVFQETKWKAYQYRRAYRSSYPVFGWLSKISLRALYAVGRKKRLFIVEVDIPETSESKQEGPDSNIRIERFWERLEECLQKHHNGNQMLVDRDMLLCRLKYAEEYSFEEMAQYSGEKRNTIKSRFLDGRRLRECVLEVAKEVFEEEAV